MRGWRRGGGAADTCCHQGRPSPASLAGSYLGIGAAPPCGIPLSAGRVSVFNSPERDTPSWLWRPTTASSSSFYEDRYPKACECLRQDRDVMFTFYDFPGGALGPPAHDQPDRIDLRHGAPSHAPDQGLGIETASKRTAPSSVDHCHVNDLRTLIIGVDGRACIHLARLQRPGFDGPGRGQCRPAAHPGRLPQSQPRVPPARSDHTQRHPRRRRYAECQGLSGQGPGADLGQPRHGRRLEHLL